MVAVIAITLGYSIAFCSQLIHTCTTDSRIVRIRVPRAGTNACHSAKINHKRVSGLYLHMMSPEALRYRCDLFNNPSGSNSTQFI